MRPVKTEWTEGELGAPPGMEDECDPLPISRHGGAIYSCWKLSPDEIKRVAKNGYIILAVHGSAHPPVRMWPSYGADDLS